MNLPLSQRAQRAQLPAISDLMKRALQNPNLVSLAAGFVDNPTLPCDEVQEAMAAIWAEQPQVALQYGTTAGYEPLRQEILDRWIAEEPSAANVSLDQVILTAGSNQMLQLATQAIVDEGDIVLCAAPTYFVYTGLLKFLGIRTVGVECDEKGMMPAALDATISRLEQEGDLHRVKLLYLVTYCDNPRGVTLPNERRQALMDCVSRVRSKVSMRVIDDSAYRALDFSESPLPNSLRDFADDPDSVIVAGTFSKSFSPGVRVGWGILPQDLVVPILEQKGHMDFGSAHLNQHLMHRVLQLGLWDRQVERLRETYRSKLDATLAALDRSKLAQRFDARWTVPDGGLYVWLELPSSIPTGGESRLLSESIERGVLYVPGEYCFPDELDFVAEAKDDRTQSSLRLSFGVTTESEIEQGVRALAEAIETCNVDSTAARR